MRAAPSDWSIKSPQNALFVRLDTRDKTRFSYSDGARYFPLGHNQAWHTDGLPDIPQLFDKMGESGENWSRVWMCHWDKENLDWPRPAGDFGTLNLNVARRWDAIVWAAERNKIAFQMVLQHHGQYSTQVNSNWNDNPYNVKNGGFLKTPQEFFTNAQAKALTRRKLRYAVARWGYSPSILAWELWNEVQFTDAARHHQWNEIAQWHREMASFLRAQDVQNHLITTSSMESIPAAIGAALDYEQNHIYPADLIAALQNTASKTPKATFVGEFGPRDLKDPQGVYLHAGLWSGLMNGQGGAPQYWFWDLVEKHNFYSQFGSAAAFLEASDFAMQNNLRRVAPKIESDPSSALTSLALCNSRFMAAWIYHRANIRAALGRENGAASGTLTLPVLDAGKISRGLVGHARRKTAANAANLGSREYQRKNRSSNRRARCRAFCAPLAFAVRVRFHVSRKTLRATISSTLNAKTPETFFRFGCFR